MVEINISEWEYKSGVSKGRTEDLASIVDRTEQELKKKTQTEIEDRAIYSQLLNTVLGVYYSLEAKLVVTNVFDFIGKDKNKVIRHYSLYNASKAVLNLLYDEKIAGIDEIHKRLSCDFDKDSMNDNSSFSILKSVLNYLNKNLQENHSSYAKYSVYEFFDNVKDYCKENLYKLVPKNKLEVLNEIKVFKEKLEFGDINAKKPKIDENPSTAKGDLNKYIPDEIPGYDNEAVDFHNCIGNTEQIEEMLNAAFMLLRYDPATQKNEFSKIGSGFQNNFLIYGKQGTGKTMAVDAVITWAKQIAEGLGKPFYVTDMSSAFKTPLVDMSGKILEEFFRREGKGDAIYLNIFDEAGGGKFGNANKTGSNQEDTKTMETAKKMFGKKGKGNILNILVTNYADEESLEGAFKQRFGKKIHLKGPRTATQFGHVLQYHLADFIQLGIVDPKIDFIEMGEIFTNYMTLERPGFAVTGRSVDMVCRNLNGVGKLYQKTKLLDNQKVKSKQLYHEYRKIHNKITAAVLRETIENYLKTELDSDYRIDRPSVKVTEIQIDGEK